jgi:hypothetical protein
MYNLTVTILYRSLIRKIKEKGGKKLKKKNVQITDHNSLDKVIYYAEDICGTALKE